jgi:hypothetical protein
MTPSLKVSLRTKVKKTNCRFVLNKKIKINIFADVAQLVRACP